MSCPCFGFAPQSPSRTGANHHVRSNELTFNNASTDARSFTSFTKHFFTKSTKSEDHPDEESEGGGMFITRFITCADVQRANGFLLSAISITLIPRAHTSLFNSAPSPYTSGPMYIDVPQVFTRFEQECSN